jgi:hypothetical protein
MASGRLKPAGAKAQDPPVGSPDDDSAGVPTPVNLPQSRRRHEGTPQKPALRLRNQRG